MLRLRAVSDQPPSFVWDSPRPPLSWLAQVNRQTLVTRLLTATVHDVNNTLQVVSGAAEVLAMDPSAAAIATRTESIVGHARSATATLRALTGFARGATAPGDRTALKAAAESAIGLRQYALRKARIAVRLSGDEVECAAAPDVVLQIVLNLLVNAEQAVAGRADAAIAVTVGAAPGNGTLEIADNGPGLSPALQRADWCWPPAAEVAPLGLGLGLIVSQGLARHDGGDLTYASAPSAGAVFLLSLPR